MLKKLMKHEFRATARIILPLLLAVLLLALLGNVSLRLLQQPAMHWTVRAVCGIMLFLFVVALAALGIASVILMIQRFYKNLLGDEGYLMFTLPVRTSSLIWSKLLVSCIWFAVTFAAVILAIMLLVIQAEDVRAVWELLSEMLRVGFAEKGWLSGIQLLPYILEMCMAGLLMCAQFCLLCYASLAIGGSGAKNKLLNSVLVFFAIQIGLQLLSIPALMLLSKISSVLFEGISFDANTWVHLALLGWCAVNAAICAVAFAVTNHFLKRKLNLA